MTLHPVLIENVSIFGSRNSVVCFFQGEKARELNNYKFLKYPWNKNNILSKLLFFFLPEYVIVHDLSYFSFLS